MRTHKKLLVSLLASTSALLISQSVLAAPVVLELDYEIPVQQNQVAFVSFAGDSVLSPIILNDLSKTELKVTNQDLPQQPHSSKELTGTLPVWQSMGIPYLVVGSTRTNRGKIITDYEVIDVKSGRVIEGKQSLTADNNRESMRYAGHVIADKVYELITGIPGDFSGRIAYIEETGTGKQKISRLKVMDADGENARTITEVAGSIFSPAWSPDGNRIAYSVQREKSYPVIYVQNVSGGGATALTPFSGSNLSPSFSPDGSKILFSSSFEGSADIYEMSASGGTPRRLTNLPSSEVQPSYAPDGKSFVFVSDKTGFNKPQVYRYEFATGQTIKVSNGGYATSPQFSSDGTQIAFLSGRSAAIMNSNGAITTNLGNTGIDEAPSFSPNGKRVVYASTQGGKGVLTIKSLNGGEAFGKSGQGVIRSPVWSSSPK
ncbi:MULTISPECIES: PD40 domain-containing protein [Psychrobacter]|uniref:PD40 domain-containing protein n=1 Tax=Psychrobacter TaxID=497 RepID=UPI00086E3AFC|nr:MULTISPECIES: PD40 domain-containing protein [Psychrobacter]MBA6244078.1 PD40 domain-containing protein [Psychrobacter sp. Urea-trap-18]MBA6284880.1 PD40 domain-containing protein [Psychrobacter sp. Urea-trap-16]MBA6319474.1 PD40 domain-containing protein [Psychrobacter sp. Urea-trap-20]MBA6335360.1 PD40 domain-containing protein [Psychrobacter sp. Urea-trap-19]OEH68962.1 MAG: translocation protein TolB [Psychrobacter sp. B29-1]|tara:strand:- start:705 stop:1997 length:1293 start_codon:yes stop_codon:yes gene_type:complete